MSPRDPLDLLSTPLSSSASLETMPDTLSGLAQLQQELSGSLQDGIEDRINNHVEAEYGKSPFQAAVARGAFEAIQTGEAHDTSQALSHVAESLATVPDTSGIFSDWLDEQMGQTAGTKNAVDWLLDGNFLAAGITALNTLAPSWTPRILSFFNVDLQEISDTTHEIMSLISNPLEAIETLGAKVERAHELADSLGLDPSTLRVNPQSIGLIQEHLIKNPELSQEYSSLPVAEQAQWWIDLLSDLDQTAGLELGVDPNHFPLFAELLTGQTEWKDILVDGALEELAADAGVDLDTIATTGGIAAVTATGSTLVDTNDTTPAVSEESVEDPRYHPIYGEMVPFSESQAMTELTALQGDFQNQIRQNNTLLYPASYSILPIVGINNLIGLGAGALTAKYLRNMAELPFDNNEADLLLVASLLLSLEEADPENPLLVPKDREAFRQFLLDKASEQTDELYQTLAFLPAERIDVILDTFTDTSVTGLAGLSETISLGLTGIIDMIADSVGDDPESFIQTSNRSGLRAVGHYVTSALRNHPDNQVQLNAVNEALQTLLQQDQVTFADIDRLLNPLLQDFELELRLDDQGFIILFERRADGFWYQLERLMVDTQSTDAFEKSRQLITASTLPGAALEGISDEIRLEIRQIHEKFQEGAWIGTIETGSFIVREAATGVVLRILPIHWASELWGYFTAGDEITLTEMAASVGGAMVPFLIFGAIKEPANLLPPLGPLRLISGASVDSVRSLVTIPAFISSPEKLRDLRSRWRFMRTYTHRINQIVRLPYDDVQAARYARMRRLEIARYELTQADIYRNTIIGRPFANYDMASAMRRIRGLGDLAITSPDIDKVRQYIGQIDRELVTTRREIVGPVPSSAISSVAPGNTPPTTPRSNPSPVQSISDTPTQIPRVSPTVTPGPSLMPQMITGDQVIPHIDDAPMVPDFNTKPARPDLADLPTPANIDAAPRKNTVPESVPARILAEARENADLASRNLGLSVEDTAKFNRAIEGLLKKGLPPALVVFSLYEIANAQEPGNVLLKNFSYWAFATTALKGARIGASIGRVGGHWGVIAGIGIGVLGVTASEWYGYADRKIAQLQSTDLVNDSWVNDAIGATNEGINSLIDRLTGEESAEFIFEQGRFVSVEHYNQAQSQVIANETIDFNTAVETDKPLQGPRQRITEYEQAINDRETAIANGTWSKWDAFWWRDKTESLAFLQKLVDGRTAILRSDLDAAESEIINESWYNTRRGNLVRTLISVFVDGVAISNRREHLAKQVHMYRSMRDEAGNTVWDLMWTKGLPEGSVITEYKTQIERLVDSIDTDGHDLAAQEVASFVQGDSEVQTAISQELE